MTIDEQLAYLGKGTVEIIREEDLRAKLEKSARSSVPLRVKLGADPGRVRQQVIHLPAGSQGTEPAAAGAPSETAPSASLILDQFGRT